MFGRWGFFCNRLFEKSNSDWHCLVLPHLSETYGGLLFFLGGWHFSLAGVGVRLRAESGSLSRFSSTDLSQVTPPPQPTIQGRVWMA